jgi:DNA-binding transcriptional ArsR family regulator
MVPDQSPELDRIFHALAHPARRAILRQLSAREQNLSELAAPLKMSFPAASKHVRVLEHAKLVRRRVSGRDHMCRLDAFPIKEIAEWAEGYREAWEANFQRLDDLLENLQHEQRSRTHVKKQRRQR